MSFSIERHPSIEIAHHTRSISPRPHVDGIQFKSAFRQEIFQSQWSPTRAVYWIVMDLYQKRSRDQEIPSAFYHGVNVPTRLIWPKQVFKDLLNDHQVKLPG